MKRHLVARPLSFESGLHHSGFCFVLPTSALPVVMRHFRTAPQQIRTAPLQIRTSQAGPAPTRSRNCHTLQSGAFDYFSFKKFH